MRRLKSNLLAGGSGLVLLGALALTPLPALSQQAPADPAAAGSAATNSAAGDPASTDSAAAATTAETPPAGKTTAEAEPDIDQLVPTPDTSIPPPPTTADIGPADAPAAPAVTVAPPAAQTPAAGVATTAPAPETATLAAADQPIADSIKELLTTKAAKYIERKNERAAVEAFYRDRAYAPLWIASGEANARAQSAVNYLKTVDSDGLDPAEYATPAMPAGTGAEALAEAELKLTNAALTFARHAATGRVSFTRISNDIYYDLQFPAPASALAKLAGTDNSGEVLASYLPQDPAYQALKKKYAEERAKIDDHAKPRIERGRLLRLDDRQPIEDARVPLLRRALGIHEDAESTLYDKTVADAVRKFQAAHGMKVDGIVGNATIAAINGPRHDKAADTILVNLERWRWLPHQLNGASGAYVMVNIPDYSLKIVRHGVEYWKTKIVVGKPGKETPLISPTMKYITVNPTWNVPPSIIAREYLPALREDPTALERIGLKLEQNKDGTVRIYQPPGDRNALGRIRFNFPNKFLVYQHDTPDKHLFKKETRAYSHGCMRVENPVTYGEKLLSIELPKERYTEAKLRSMFGSNEVNINFPKPLPVHITYQTAFVDEAGKLQLRNDIYGHDARMLRALKTDERKVADIAVEQRAIGSAAISRDELMYEDRSNPAFENPFFNLFRPREAPRAYGRNARDDHYERRYDRRYEQRGRDRETRNFFDIFR